MLTNNTKAIISLTSHKTRIKHCAKTIYSAIRNCVNDVHVVLTISKENKKYITDDIKLLIDTGVVELLLVDEDLGPHTKYFYCMKKYRHLPIITIDDDQHYYANTIPNLIKKHNELPTAIIGRQARIIVISHHKVLPFSVWAKGKLQYKEGVNKLNHLMGVGAILYPPNALNVNDDMLKDIRICRKADDIYLNALEIRLNIPRYCLLDYGKMPTEWDELYHQNKDMTTIALREEKTRWRDSDKIFNYLKQDFDKLL